MPDSKSCRQCGQTITSEGVRGLCPRCLGDMAFGDGSEAGRTLTAKTLRVEPPAITAGRKAEGPGTIKGAHETGPGDIIGRYKLLQEIGEGGCGVVYMAEQEEPVRRRVALKAIKLGMDTKQVIARFEAERQALAMMDHPNIAKVLDAGATEQGRPFFVMELVRGIKLTDYCDQHQLSTAGRLELFIQVCKAVHHAHQKGIIHRDLKPSNILVTVNDGVPVPKVIDFGIAKATQGRLTDETLFTAFEQFIGTPAYMSPEQAEFTSLDIDTRSDIYSLGVLLYELLTGKTPFDTKRLLEAGLDGIRRIIREEDPPRPSTRLSSLNAEEQTTLAKRRQCPPPKLVHSVRGDLDWIVMKCLEKDRTRRYETTNALALDIQRHLSNEPVSAVAPSALYKFQKFARRRKAALAAASAFVVLLVSAATISSVLAVRAERSGAIARAESEQRKQALTRVQLEVAENLFTSDPSKALGKLASLLRDEPTNRIVAERLLNALSSRSFRVPVWPSFRKGVSLARFSRDGQRMALGISADQASSVQVFGEDDKLLADLPHGASPIQWLDISSDGATVATVTEDRLRAWAVPSQRLLLDEPSTNGRLWQVQLLSSPRRCVTLAERGVLLYDLEERRLLQLSHTPAGGLIKMAVSEPAQLLGITDETGSVQLFDLNSLKPLRTISMAHTGLILHVEFNANGSRLVTASADSFARVWDPRTGERSAELAHSGTVCWATFSPDGERIATASRDGTAQLWQPTGQTIGGPMAHRAGVTIVRFSPDGGQVLTTCEDGTAREWNVPDCSPASEPARFRQQVLDATFVPKGQMLVVVAQRGAQLLKRTTPPSWQPVKELSPPPRAKLLSHEEAILARGHAGKVAFVDLSPDGKLIAAASEDETARLWDRKTLQRIGEPLIHDAAVNCARFSPDGQRLVTSTANQLVRVWDARTSAALSDWLPCGEPVASAWFAPDGRSVITASGYTFPMLIIEGQVPDWVATLAEAVAGFRFQEGIGEPVSDGLFLELKADLARRRGNDPLTVWAQQFVNPGPEAELR